MEEIEQKYIEIYMESKKSKLPESTLCGIYGIDSTYYFCWKKNNSEKFTILK